MALKHSKGISNRILIAGGVCLGLFDAFVLSNAWLMPHSWILSMLAIALAQCVLVAAWAGTSKANLGLRFGLPLLAIWVNWKVIQHVIALPFESMWMTLWMIVLIWVVVIVLAGVRANRVIEESRDSRDFWMRYVRVDLKTMMMLTLAAGVAFAFVQYGRVHWQWSFDSLRPREFFIVNLLGFLTGIQGITCLGILCTGKPSQRLYRAGLHFAGLIAFSFLFGCCDTRVDLKTSVRETLPLWLQGNAVIIFSVVVGRGLSAKLTPASQSETQVKSI